jgi:hypothetical protein
MTDLLENTNVTYKERLECEKEWILSLDDLAKKISGEALLLLEDCIKIKDGYLVPGEPAADSTGDKPGIKRYGDNESVGLAVLFSSDADIHSYFYNLIQEGIATYSEKMNGIIIAPGEVSPEWRAILLFHELQHVKYHKLNLFRGTKNGYWVEEQQIYNDEFKIISQLYGKKYSGVISKNALLIAEKLKKGSLVEQDLVDSANNVITALFKNPKSKLEDKMRRGAIIISIGFDAMDKLGLGSPDNYARFVESLVEGKENNLWGWVVDIVKAK